MTAQPLIEARNLTKHYEDSGGLLQKGTTTRALNGVSFEIQEGEVFGVVGESGSGKSTLGETLLNLHYPTSGTVYFEGENFTALSKRERRSVRSEIQMIFQDSGSSLNPKLRVQRIVDEPLREHTAMDRDERVDRVKELLTDVGLKPEHRSRFVHQFSGGQRQRINIARAIALRPKFIVADEPFSALDVSVKAQLIELLDDLKEKYNLTIMIITHDLGTIKQIADRTMVMYLGEAMEIGPTERIFNDPNNPYTRSLLSSIVIPGEKERGEPLKGEIPSPEDPPSGCPFHTRCPEYIGDICEAKKPDKHNVDGTESMCHLHLETND